MQRGVSLMLSVLALAACSDRHVPTAATIADAGTQRDARVPARVDAGTTTPTEADASDDDDDAGKDAFPPLLRHDASDAQPSPHPDVLRIVDWNVEAGRGSSIAQVTDRLKSLEPDIITLQELDDKTYRSAGIDQPAYIASALALNYVFAETIPWFGGTYGIASFSRYPFESLRRITLSNQYAAELRTALEARMCTPHGCLRVINHHADTQPLASSVSIKEIVDELVPALGTGLVLTGDFNQAPTDLGPVYTVAQGFVDVGASYGDMLTEGGRRIDYWFLDRKLAPCVKSMMTLEDVMESDHAPIVIDLDLSCVDKQ